MSKIVFLISIMLYFSYDQNMENEEIIIWTKETKLEWENFNGIFPSGSEHAANSKCLVRCKGASKNNQITLNVYAYFVKDESWKKNPNEKSSRLLNHEQRHFDIAEYYSRLCKKRLSELIINDRSSAAEKINSLNNNIDIELRQFQKLYDAETDHGLISEAQIKWNIKIDSLIMSLEKYNSNLITIDLSKK